MRRHRKTLTYLLTYLPSSRKASPPLDRYQIILLGDRGACLWVNNLPKVVAWKRNGRGSNPRPFESRVQRSDHYAVRPLWAVVITIVVSTGPDLGVSRLSSRTGTMHHVPKSNFSWLLSTLFLQDIRSRESINGGKLKRKVARFLGPHLCRTLLQHVLIHPDNNGNNSWQRQL